MPSRTGGQPDLFRHVLLPHDLQQPRRLDPRSGRTADARQRRQGALPGRRVRADLPPEAASVFRLRRRLRAPRRRSTRSSRSSTRTRVRRTPPASASSSRPGISGTSGSRYGPPIRIGRLVRDPAPEPSAVRQDQHRLHAVVLRIRRRPLVHLRPERSRSSGATSATAGTTSAKARSAMPRTTSRSRGGSGARSLSGSSAFRGPVPIGGAGPLPLDVPARRFAALVDPIKRRPVRTEGRTSRMRSRYELGERTCCIPGKRSSVVPARERGRRPAPLPRGLDLLSSTERRESRLKAQRGRSARGAGAIGRALTRRRRGRTGEAAGGLEPEGIRSGRENRGLGGSAPGRPIAGRPATWCRSRRSSADRTAARPTGSTTRRRGGAAARRGRPDPGRIRKSALTTSMRLVRVVLLVAGARPPGGRARPAGPGPSRGTARRRATAPG